MITKPKVLIHVAIEKHLTKKIEKVAVVDELAVTAPREELLQKIGDVEGILLTPRVRADSVFLMLL